VHIYCFHILIMVNVKGKMKGLIFGHFVENLAQKRHAPGEYTTHILRTNYDQRSGQCRICMWIVSFIQLGA
jgi:hypothetical protein